MQSYVVTRYRKMMRNATIHFSPKNADFEGLIIFDNQGSKYVHSYVCAFVHQVYYILRA